MSTKDRTALPRVVEMVRVSSRGQADRDTPELQRRALEALRQSRPGAVVERIEAPGVSGALPVDQRPDLQRLSALTSERAYDELRVYALDRLTRSSDMRERAAIWGMVADAGAVIVDCGGRVLDPADESGIGEIDYYLQTFFAARERQKIRRRTHDGRMRAASAGVLCQGQPPFGRRFDKRTGIWSVYEPEADIYRRIFVRILAGASAREIARELNADGISATRSPRWYHSTIKRLLHTPAAYGCYSTMGMTTQIPAIVDEATWREAQRALEANRDSAGRPGSKPAMLRRVLTCGICGRTANVLTSHSDEPTRYGCPAARNVDGEPCPDRRTHLVEVADRAVRAELVRTLTDPRVLRAAAGLDGAAAPSGGAEKELETVDREMKRLRDQEKRLLRLLDEGMVSEDVARARLAEIRASRTSLDGRKLAAADALGASEARAIASGDVEEIAADLADRVRAAPLDRWSELVRLLFPKRAPYHLSIWPDRRITGVGRLPLGPAMAERIATGELDAPSARRVQIAGPAISFNFETLARP